MRYVHFQEGNIAVVRYQGLMKKLTSPYGGPYKIVCREGNGYFGCILDENEALEYPTSVSDELTGLVKKANALEEFTSKNQVQPTEETQFSLILDHRPSIRGDGSQEYLLQWIDAERIWTHESDMADADILTLYRQRTRRKHRQSWQTKSTATSTDERSANNRKHTK
ncbi:hypothetical protein SARC_07380 [Sphaeroforma arctica JP610]|uniref:Chromo domain-containing protein n=1 Tax=Sphaeroforma arctica JP610 TaxID=667725 RepID=A0A0L0FTV7_9EUKA|nr:hypothetical protein SARC_07380 [Sphaeroforma arctica JP610]KNC80257.1 hypothetical protein SARC_07380 [Sphaeroforma arctica JP610]|eukprot:XP_014154159.1 hypothetical protein SARC_07380 [Sphaeroforma arctica JP610]